MLQLQKSLKMLRSLDYRMTVVNCWRLVIGIPAIFIIVLLSLPVYPWVNYKKLITSVALFVKRWGSILVALVAIVVLGFNLIPMHPIRVAAFAGFTVLMFMLDKAKQLF